MHLSGASAVDSLAPMARIQPLAPLWRLPAAQRARKRYKWARVRYSYQAHQHVLGNRSSAKQFEAAPPALNDAQQQVVESLRRDGLAIVHFDDLVGDASLWAGLQATMDEWVAEAEKIAAEDASEGPRKKDQFLLRRGRRIERNERAKGNKFAYERLSIDSPWIRYPLSDSILRVVNSYRGMWTKLIDMDQWYTVPFGGGHDRVASQNWHRDPEDLHVVKVFTYFNDVNEEAGPFQYIPGSAKGGRYGDLWPWTVTGETYPSQEELAKRIPASEVRTMTGRAGTVIFCDTSGFHRGGFARSQPRVMSYHTFVSPASLLSRREKRRFIVESPNGNLSEPQRFALT